MLKPQFLLTNKIPVTVYRREAGRHVDGEWVEGDVVEIPVQVNIQPLKGYEILQFPESERTRVWWKVYSADVLRTEKEGPGGWDADELVWKNDRYKVMKVDDWSGAMSILEHTKSYITRIGLTPN